MESKAHNSYNDEPVFYCKNCLSLKIKPVPVDDNFNYCEECGSTDVEQINIKDWEIIYKDKYGINFLEK